MAAFNVSLPYVITNEGTGYEGPPITDQPTNTGIIAADVAKYRMVPLSSITIEIMKSLTYQEIEDIYLQQYWNPLRLSEVIDQSMATCIFDISVNRGLTVGPKYAQRVCNLNGGALVVDGVVGTRSLAAINSQDRKAFIRHMVSMMESGYDSIIAAHPVDEKYRRGWFNRANRLLTLI